MGSDRRVKRRGLAWLVVATGLLAPSVALGQISPGDLARAHARLEGVQNCTKCHSSGDAVSAALCLSCHTALRSAIRAGGYHSKVQNRACESCHPDHQGRGAAMVRWPGGMRGFDHTRNTGYALRGKHAQTECRGCHKAQYVRGAMGGASRGRTFLGLPSACVGCHADPHQPTLGTRCESCHDESSWGGATGRFDHSRARFPLRGAHVRVACARCHPGASEDRPATYRGVAFAQCTDCHRDPHEAKMGGPASCTGCHDEVRWANSRYVLSRHAPRTFPLTGAHVRTVCTACHGTKLAATVRSACVSCHDDAHRPSLGTTCNQCHSTASWSGGPVAARAPQTFHDRTAFPLEGRHAAVDCPACHLPSLPARRRFRPIAHGHCSDCHEDAHHGELQARADTGACEACHDLQGWTPSSFEARDHAATRFALDGAHRAVPCASCHPAPPAAPAFRREDRSCESCHQDPHGGQFAGRASAQAGCAGCHATAAWAPSRFGRMEHVATGFTLDGAHDAACVRCHAPSRAATTTAFVGVDRECGACHADVHARQFADLACSRCHAGARFTPTVGFDHARTRFPLGGQHRDVRCPDCHGRVDLPGARGTVVYRLGARSCESCHDSPHGRPDAPGGSRAAELARATGDCAACHRDDSWGAVSLARAARFDHALTDAPLVGAHEAVPCARCHASGRTVAPMQECSSCHEDRHAQRMTEPCSACHTPRSWAQDRTLDAHRRTRLPLVGVHAVQACRTCHRRAAEGDFRDARPDCESCHLHTVRERSPHPPHVGVAFLTRCDRCHGADAWLPAHFDHNRFWPLTGRHQSTACSGCHLNGVYAGTPRDCADAACHGLTPRARPVDHTQFDDHDCAECHDTNAWQPADFPLHDPFFPLRGDHHLDCARCHADPDSYSVFTCMDGCHQNETRHHDEVRGFSNDSAACYRCHPRGRAEDD